MANFLCKTDAHRNSLDSSEVINPNLGSYGLNYISTKEILESNPDIFKE